ncbi:hypothetical protein B566_EDAN003677 [Ephemera danica]|nr:hypothetical protein B566_EDAN003677 [Ephemera danica]
MTQICVFCAGNFLVILVVQCDRQVESKTNFLLGQLALADLCVGVFCVMQSFMAYLSNWLLGLFLCQMYLYVQALSYVASVLIMVAVCVERYVAIMQPFHTRSVFTSVRLRLIVVLVWVVSAAYAAPRLFFARVTSQALRHSTERDTFCHLDTRRYDPDAFDTANLILLYAAPLIAMAAMYSRMCVELWRSGRRVPAGAAEQPGPLAARRRVVLMLMLVVLSFLLCNLPYHARKMWQARLRSQPHLHTPSNSIYSKLFTPATFLVMYLNSALNPVLYVTMSRSFRRAVMRRLRLCTRSTFAPCLRCFRERQKPASPLIGRLGASESSTRNCSAVLHPLNGHNMGPSLPETVV